MLATAADNDAAASDPCMACNRRDVCDFERTDSRSVNFLHDDPEPDAIAHGDRPILRARALVGRAEIVDPGSISLICRVRGDLAPAPFIEQIIENRMRSEEHKSELQSLM